MIRLDLFWESNPEWYHVELTPEGIEREVINASAPPQAQESYKNYRKQMDYINMMAKEHPEVAIL